MMGMGHAAEPLTVSRKRDAARCAAVCCDGSMVSWTESRCEYIVGTPMNTLMACSSLYPNTRVVWFLDTFLLLFATVLKMGALTFISWVGLSHK